MSDLLIDIEGDASADVFFQFHDLDAALRQHEPQLVQVATYSVGTGAISYGCMSSLLHFWCRTQHALVQLLSCCSTNHDQTTVSRQASVLRSLLHDFDTLRVRTSQNLHAKYILVHERRRVTGYLGSMNFGQGTYNDVMVRLSAKQTRIVESHFINTWDKAESLVK